VALDERVALELGEMVTVFVGLAAPHPAHSIGASLPEAIN
jgi:hypothetical protein